MPRTARTMRCSRWAGKTSAEDDMYSCLWHHVNFRNKGPSTLYGSGVRKNILSRSLIIASNVFEASVLHGSPAPGLSSRSQHCPWSELFSWKYRANMETRILHINVQRFRGGLVFKAHRLCVSFNFRLESNKEEKEHALIPASTHFRHFVRCNRKEYSSVLRNT